MNTLEKLKQTFKGKTATSVSLDPSNFNRIDVRYQDTYIARIEERPSSIIVKLNSGGRLTKTTKARMNAVLDALGIDAGVYQRKGEWFLRDVAEELPFADGLSIERAS